MIAIIDYGMGNLRSVSKAFEAIGAKVEVTNNLSIIAKAKAVVLPGVGAFHMGMKNLNRLNITPLLREAIKDKTPFLGICLGLQLLFTESHEHGLHKGLDIIKGKVKKFDGGVKVPHMGWNTIKLPTPNSQPQIFKDIPDNTYFYFVHTYYVEPEDKNVVVATTKYGKDFASVINKDNVWGVQFHPEKSVEIGLKFLENFCRYYGIK